jgi:adenosylhomocysteinase
MKYKVKDIKLAAQGSLQLELAERDMPVLRIIRERIKKSKPFKGLTIAACLHVTKETGILLRTLQFGGAHVTACGSNPLSTQDDVAACLAKDGVEVFAWKDQSDKDYYWCLNQVLNRKPDMTLDDGADLISLIHGKRRELLKYVKAGQEETTTGVIRLKAMARAGALKYPIIAVNDADTKHLFDNIYGTGQSTWDGILRATNTMVAGKTVVIAGYGHCGHGVSTRARGMGANVIVTEIDPLPALQAVMDGFRVLPMSQAAPLGDIFVTVTGNKNVIRPEHVKKMKSGAILANSGHFNVEIDVAGLKKISKSVLEVRTHLKEYILPGNRRIYLIADGRLVNLAAAEGHPSSVMDMSFANQALCCEYLLKNYRKLAPDVFDVPIEIDKQVAILKLKSMNVSIDKLTPEQQKYLAGWQEGT